MRSTGILVAICLAFIMAAGSTVFAVERKSPGSALRPGTGKPTIKELTTNECIGLGGDVLAETGCKSGKVCRTTDSKGRKHWQCITKLS